MIYGLWLAFMWMCGIFGVLMLWVWIRDSYLERVRKAHEAMLRHD